MSISKELLSEVLGIDAKIDTDSMEVWEPIDEFEGAYAQVNIHELAHKCKEWAFDKHLFIIMSEKHSTHWYCVTTYEIAQTQSTFIADTEPEAVFKACQYILDQHQENCKSDTQ